MPARNIAVAGIVAIVAVVAVVIVFSQFSAGSDATPTPGNQTPTATLVASPGTSPTAVSGTPSPGPTDTATATPAPPTPTPTPQPPDTAFFAVILLASELSAPVSEFRVTSYAQATWPAADYGCPAPGMFYAQREVNGWIITIERQGQEYEFHADANDQAGETLVNCSKNRELLAGTINPVELAGLSSTTGIEMRRRNSQTGEYDLWNTVTEQDDIDAILATLDVPMTLSEAASCTPTFRLVFITPAGNQTFDAICGGNSRLVRGGQGFWNGMQGTAPQQFGSVIGPYYSDVPLPAPPTATVTGQ